MTAKSGAQALYGDIAPELAALSDQVLFGRVWEDPSLSKRDRSLATCAALVATGKVEQMEGHFGRALDNGVTRTELIALITHLAFYSGWPSAVSATARARATFAKADRDAASPDSDPSAPRTHPPTPIHPAA
jgi:4-carboxymuconolactone decarboxylase